MEVKPSGNDAWLTASSNQVSRYWGRYRLVLVTNTRDFILVSEDTKGNPMKLETFRLSESEQEFEARLEKPRTFARDMGAGLGGVPVPGALSYRRHRGAEGPGVAPGVLCQGRASKGGGCRGDCAACQPAHRLVHRRLGGANLKVCLTTSDSWSRSQGTSPGSNRLR